MRKLKQKDEMEEAKQIFFIKLFKIFLSFSLCFSFLTFASIRYVFQQPTHYVIVKRNNQIDRF